VFFTSILEHKIGTLELLLSTFLINVFVSLMEVYIEPYWVKSCSTGYGKILVAHIILFICEETRMLKSPFTFSYFVISTLPWVFLLAFEYVVHSSSFTSHLIGGIAGYACSISSIHPRFIFVLL
jgi:membrane associated rhomboid family serine protease